MSAERQLSNAIIIGSSIMLISIMMVIFKLAWVLLYFIFLFPGFAFGLSLSSGYNEKGWKGVLFLFISGLSYMGCFWLMGIFHPGTETLIDTAKVVGCSCLGALILSIAYQFLLLNKFSWARSLLCIVIVGIATCLPCAICIYITLGNRVDTNSHVYVSTLLYAGIFTIYPLWQTAFVWVMNTERFKPVSEKTATAS